MRELLDQDPDHPDHPDHPVHVHPPTSGQINVSVEILRRAGLPLELQHLIDVWNGDRLLRAATDTTGPRDLIALFEGLGGRGMGSH